MRDLKRNYIDLMTASIEFFKGISEELSNVSLRKGKQSGNKIVLMTFKTLKAIEILNSFTMNTLPENR